jgi:hypothetical protein
VLLSKPLLKKAIYSRLYGRTSPTAENRIKNMFQTAAAPPAASTWTVQFPLNEMEVGLHSFSTTRNGKHNSKRRFDDSQIRSLETIFETESRPELRVKQHLANKLGLQPRQVAIWFQNKRARSKSKQIEREFNMLKGSYDNLVSKYESLKKENESLLIQVKIVSKPNRSLVGRIYV